MSLILFTLTIWNQRHRGFDHSPASLLEHLNLDVKKRAESDGAMKCKL
jgi:hypothetical protein